MHVLSSLCCNVGSDDIDILICVFKSCYRGSRPIVTYATGYMYILYKKRCRQIDNLTSKGGKREKTMTRQG